MTQFFFYYRCKTVSLFYISIYNIKLNKKCVLKKKTENFGSPNLAKLKNKSRNTTKYHSIFTIPSILIVVDSGLIFYFILNYKELIPQ